MDVYEFFYVCMARPTDEFITFQERFESYSAFPAAWSRTGKSCYFLLLNRFSPILFCLMTSYEYFLRVYVAYLIFYFLPPNPPNTMMSVVTF